MRGSTITLEEYPVEEAVRLFHEAGFDSLEMWKHHLKRARTAEIRGKFAAFAQEYGVSMGGFNAVGEDYFRPFETETHLRQTIDGIKADTDFAIALGTRDVLLWEGRAPERTSETEWLDRLLPRSIEMFQDVIAYGKPLGIRYLVEPHPFTVGMSDKFLTRLCDSLDESHFGVTYDFCHYGVGRSNEYIAAVHNLGDCIKHLHFSDSDQQSSELHFPPGHGRMDIQGILGAFKEIGYNGTATLDLYGYPTPLRFLRESCKLLKEACDFLEIEESAAAAP